MSVMGVNSISGWSCWYLTIDAGAIGQLAPLYLFRGAFMQIILNFAGQIELNRRPVDSDRTIRPDHDADRLPREPRILRLMRLRQRVGESARSPGSRRRKEG